MLALVSCSVSPTTTAIVSPSPAHSLAADTRTQLDLLLGEHIVVVAKIAEAAANQTDDYAAYLTLLAANSSALQALFSRAFGNTAATEMLKTWDQQNGYLIDYVVGAVTHDDTKAKSAMLTLGNEFVPGFAQQLADASGLTAGDLSAKLGRQVTMDKAFVDDLIAQSYDAFYNDLHTAYTQTSKLGDAVMVGVARRYPDKFPGDVQDAEVDARVTLNLLLQEASYVTTLATAATAAARTAESTAAAAAMGRNQQMLAATASGPAFGDAWMARNSAFIRYATGDQSAREALTRTFVNAFAAATGAPAVHVAGQVDLTLTVVDDQRAKATKAVAGDDRAAAAAMQSVADSI